MQLQPLLQEGQVGVVIDMYTIVYSALLLHDAPHSLPHPFWGSLDIQMTYPSHRWSGWVGRLATCIACVQVISICGVYAMPFL